LEIIGIHTPEFAFEKNIDNVREAMKKFGIKYSIVLDNDYATWLAYGNQYWPRKYLIDIYGNIVYDHIGEGGYEETEMKIQELLAERAEVFGINILHTDGKLVASQITPAQVSVGSPETYFGAFRNTYLANGTTGESGQTTFTLPNTFVRNELYLGGTWNIASEYAETAVDSKVVYKYNAKEVYLVADADTETSVEVFQDGMPIDMSKGMDVGLDGKVKIKESRLYKLILNSTPGEHILELRANGNGVRFYAFTFG